MSQAPFENIGITEADRGPDAVDKIGDRLWPPRSTPSQAWQGESGFVDSSGPIFSMYMEMAEEEDKKMAESWKADADGILIFTGLFSAVVASLISVSIQDLQQNPQDTSNFYLANMYKATIADLNRSNISSSLPAFPPPFSPSTHAVWVNSLWFLSLVISITCALLATLLQQWARRYLKVTRTRSSLHKRARIRSFYVEGVKKSHLSIIVEALPTLIHLSVSLFFAGLVVFLWSVNLTIFKVVLSWIGVCTALYGCITLIPIFRHDSPYRSPLTSLARLVVSVIILVLALLWACFHILATVLCCASCFPNSGPARIFSHLGSWVVRVLSSTQMSPEEAVLKSSSEIDTRAFTWTFDSLDEDHELVRFFSGLPGFHNSRVLKEPLHGLDDRQKLRLLEAAIRLLDRTLSSNLLSVQVRRQRADICANAIDLVVTPGVFPTIVRKLASEDRYGPAQSTEIVDFVRRWDDRKGEDTTLVQAMFSIVVARVQRHDDSWFRLASSELGIPEIVLREYATHGDNLSLAILIYVTRQQFIHIREPSWPSKAISDVLRAASKFNTQDTSPELQHEFCALWNQIVQDAQKGSSNIPEHILGPIRAPYIVLHQGTNSAPTQFSSTTGDDDINLWVRDAYPVCNVSGHIRNDSTSPRCPPIVPHDNAALPPASGSLVSTAVPSFPSPAPSFPSPAPSFPSPAPSFPSPAPSFPSPALPYVYNSLTTMLLDNSHPTGQSIETFHAPVNSPDQPIPGAMPDTVYLSIATPLPTPETSTSTPPHFSTSPPASVSSRHSANILAPPRPPNTPSSVSSNPALDNIHHTATTTPSASPDLTSTTARGATPENDGIPSTGLREEKDALHPHDVNPVVHTGTINTLNLQSSSSPSSVTVTDSGRVVASCSPQEPIARHIGGEHPPHISHCSYDIV